MSNAYESIGNALNYDACEIALIKGSLNDALRIACMLADMASEVDSAPVSVKVDVDARGSVATVRPGK